MTDQDTEERLKNKPEIKPDAVYTVKEAAYILGLKHISILRHIRKGNIKGTMLGRRLLVKGRALDEFLEANVYVINKK